MFLTAAVCGALLCAAPVGASDDERPWLGISFSTGPAARGVEITEIIPDTPADDAGFAAHDLIVSIDGNRLTHSSDLVEQIARKKIGDEVAVKILRDEADLVINVTLERFPTPDELLYKRMVGTTAPALDIEVVNGTATVANLPGRVLVVEMFATWCTACESTHDELSKLAIKYSDSDLVVLAVANEGRESLIKWQGASAWSHNIARDVRSTWRDYQMNTAGAALPTIFVIDEKGTVIFAGIGADRLQDATFIAERAVRTKNRK